MLDWINGGWKTSPYAKTEVAGFGIDVDGLFGFQCKDFVQAYSIMLGKPFTNGNAITLLNPQPGWVWTTSPQAGDVFVRHAVFNGTDYGDTGCVQSVMPGGVNVVQQNLKADLLHGSPPAPYFWTFSQLIGYLRKEEDMPISQSPVDETAVKQAYNAGLLRDATPAEVEARVKAGNTLQDMQTSILASVEHKAIIAKVNTPSTVVPYSGPTLFVEK